MTDPTPEQLREWADALSGFARPIWGRLADEVCSFLRAEADRRERGDK